jgi:hypothetical protein
VAHDHPREQALRQRRHATRLLKDFARTRWVRPSELRRRRFA